MRDSDRQAFIEDYLELCRRYGLCLAIPVDIIPFDEYEEREIKAMLEEL